MKFILNILIAGFLGQMALAENTLTTSALKAPKWKTSFNSYFYDFEGTRAQKNNLYEFGDTTLKMQMMGLQYQTDSGWTLMMMAQYYENFVVTKAGGMTFKDSSRGLADTLFSAAKPVFITGSAIVLADAGFTVPTGTIDEEVPSIQGRHYPYNMQLGSGTYDVVLGVTPLYLTQNYQLGSRLSTIVRLGDKNDNGYKLGNQYRLDAWVDVPVKYGFTPRVVGYYKYKDAIQGQDKTFGRHEGVEFYHHSQINWDVSAAVKYQHAFSPTVAVNAEAGVPMAQDCQNFDNVVVSTQYYVNLGVTGQF